MRKYVIAAMSTAAVCAACGSASQSSTSGSASKSSTPKLPLSAYLVRGHEETGMQPTGRATAYVTAGQWTSKGVPNAAVEDKRLAQEGFRNVISVQTGQGVSWAMELGSASAAAREGGGAKGVRPRAGRTSDDDALHRPRYPQRRGLGLPVCRRQRPVHRGQVSDARRRRPNHSRQQAPGSRRRARHLGANGGQARSLRDLSGSSQRYATPGDRHAV